jgi:uncharacterized repeat protein (TIGR03803 family)
VPRHPSGMIRRSPPGTLSSQRRFRQHASLWQSGRCRGTGPARWVRLCETHRIVSQNGNAYEEGLGDAWGPIRNGALYGTTTGGGAFSTGTIFELAPPVAASIVWTETVLYDTHDVGPAYTNFPQAPYAGLTIGKQGTL